MLELSQLSGFVAAAEEMHFGRAAQRLNMTQPTLSRQIQNLERALKVQLFDRANRTVKLTAAGRAFLPEAKRILVLTEGATNWTRRVWHGEAGVIRLGFTATAAFADLPIILDRVATELSDVKVVLKEGTKPAQRDALLSDMLDVALLRPPIDRSKFKAVQVRREGFVAAFPKDDPRATQEVVSLKDLHGRNFIMYSADGAGYSHGILAAMFDQAGLSPNITHYLDQNYSILALVSAGLGAALVPDAFAPIAFPNVVFRTLDFDPPAPLEMLMVWRAENLNPALPAFLSLCQSVLGGR